MIFERPLDLFDRISTALLEQNPKIALKPLYIWTKGLLGSSGREDR